MEGLDGETEMESRVTEAASTVRVVGLLAIEPTGLVITTWYLAPLSTDVTGGVV